jgi:signal transduction histidine kinase
MLSDFLALHREELLGRARERVALRNAPQATELELTFGLPVFFDQLREALRRAASNEVIDHSELERSASHHGHDLFHQGLTVAQVVHDYGDLCQVIALLAVELKTNIAAEEFRTLNLCLDDAIAGAVTEYSRQRERVINEQDTERLGMLAHEMRNLLGNAILSFASIKSGIVAPGGSTGAVHDRSLMGLQTLVDRSLADVRLNAGVQSLERIRVCEILEEIEISASLFAQARGIRFSVISIGPEVVVAADRQILAAAIANLLQNAFKFTRPGSKVTLRASATAKRAMIEIEDECGGLPAGKHELLLQPFTQRGDDRSGLGLGLSICVKAAKSMAGELRVRDLPGAGCIFALDLPRALPPTAAAVQVPST